MLDAGFVWSGRRGSGTSSLLKNSSMPLIPVHLFKREWSEGMKKKLFRIVGIVFLLAYSL